MDNHDVAIQFTIYVLNCGAIKSLMAVSTVRDVLEVDSRVGKPRDYSLTPHDYSLEQKRSTLE